MARVPAVGKRSAAQVAAGKKFAAAGRAAQAKKRATAKAAGKRVVTKAQHQAALKWAAAGRAAQAAKKKGKLAPKKAAAVAPADVTLLPGWWVPGCNDVLASCAAAAVANHLLAATGRRMSEDDVRWVHERAGGDDGAFIESVLEFLRSGYHALSCGVVRLSGFTPTDEGVIVAGLVVGVSLPHARHAVLSHPRGMVSWGSVLPWNGDPYEAWALEWTW